MAKEAELEHITQDPKTIKAVAIKSKFEKISFLARGIAGCEVLC